MGTHAGSAFELMIFKVYIYSLAIVKRGMGEGVYSVGQVIKSTRIFKILMKLNS